MIATSFSNRQSCLQPVARPHGFSMIELIVSLAIFAILTALAVCGVQKVRAAATRTTCASNLRQIAIASHHYEANHRSLPAGCSYPGTNKPNGRSGRGLSWQTSLLPYLDRHELWSRCWDANTKLPPAPNAVHDQLMAVVVPVFLCPADGRSSGHNQRPNQSWALSDYTGVSGSAASDYNGVLFPGTGVRFVNIRDGSSNTIMIGERPPGPNGNYGAWYASWGTVATCPVVQVTPAGLIGNPPASATGCDRMAPAFSQVNVDDLCSVGHYHSLHVGGANFVFADASVRFLPYSAAKIVPALATRAGGESDFGLD